MANYILVSCDKKIIRKTPESKSEIITTVPKDTKLKYLGLKENGWLKVQYNNQVGWVYEKGTQSTLIEEPKARVYILAKYSGKAIRTAPNGKAVRVGQTKEGAKYPYQGQMINKWYLIEYRGRNAWIFSSYGKEVM